MIWAVSIVAEIAARIFASVIRYAGPATLIDATMCPVWSNRGAPTQSDAYWDVAADSCRRRAAKGCADPPSPLRGAATEINLIGMFVYDRLCSSS